MEDHPALKQQCTANPNVRVFFSFAPEWLSTDFTDVRWDVELMQNDDEAYVRERNLEGGNLVPVVQLVMSLGECQERFPKLFEVRHG
jgi:hypothetical protein